MALCQQLLGKLQRRQGLALLVWAAANYNAIGEAGDVVWVGGIRHIQKPRQKAGLRIQIAESSDD